MSKNMFKRTLSIFKILCLGVIVIVLNAESSIAQNWPSPYEKNPSYTIMPQKGLILYRAPEGNKGLGELQEVEIFEPEHHVYRVPFYYKNVTIDGWYEYSDKGVEIAADVGSITIIEEKPIVSVTIVGSGCSGSNYNIVEWWGEGEGISNTHGQLVKRSRIDNLKGQHNAWLQKAFTENKKFKTAEEANEFIDRLQRIVYAMSSGYYMPGSIMTGLYENTAYFRIGDVNEFSEWREDTSVRSITGKYDVHKVVIRAGGLDYEDPGSDLERYPADYAIRLIDIVVKK